MGFAADRREVLRARFETALKGRPTCPRVPADLALDPATNLAGILATNQVFLPAPTVGS